MWNSTKITELLNIQYPILQGPMGGGFSTPALLASVSNAGGLGSYGAYTLTPEEILQAGKAIKEVTDKPYNINLWVNDVDKTLIDYPLEKIEKIKQIYKPFFDELGIPLPDLSTAIPSKFEKQVEVLFEIKPAVFSFIFGIPSTEILRESRKLGIKTVGAATTLEEALALEDAQVDAIVAAGFEAGGHRPSFLRPAQDSFTGLFSLLQQLKAKIKTPIIAAGGITDAKGIAAALTLGADAVQLGTAFMVTDESGAHPIHKEVLFSGALNHTTISKSLTGRMGRMVSNKISESVPFETEVLPFPLQTKLIAPLRVAALAQNRTDMISFWSGQNNNSLKHHSAEALMQALISETSALLDR
ncbi:NAD(P)H-dependent flavin oxidoreductase [Flavobacterium hungaricum]|uniref:Propionate 3-nitronate monooxygenase n=1 Tax=Flavobacterium hungaricum TaxID=2082725 RepID=A0ABR9TS75_9FLAO|nr:nitronate monooxygenase [Flavobacterium hungaricum]MBE8728203.1 nitronate monooxygenase [Flavobacterium hungaricum]